MAIDLLGKELTNIKKGFQSRLFGRRSLDEIRRDLGSDDTIYINDLPDDSILININNTYVKRMSGIHLAIQVFSKGYRPKQGKVAP